MRITSKMRRELEQAVNPLEELLIIIKQYFPKLTAWIDNLTDSRNQSYITYDLKVCLLTQILAFCSSYQSMNKMGRDFNSDIVTNNINHILNTNYIELPHKDTLINVISEIKFEELENVQTNIIKTLIRTKMLDKYRFNGMFHVVIDGTGLYSTKVNIDRIIMLLTDEVNLREVQAFPMSVSGQDQMMGCPSELSEKQLREVHIKVRD